MTAVQHFSRSEQETANIAAAMAILLKEGDVLCLEGDLGTGKSVFARALVRALAGDAGLEVPSPTFTLVQTYETPGGIVWHFDLYRLRHPDEIIEIGWEDARGGGIVLVEWPERLGPYLPKRRWVVSLKDHEGGRSIDIMSPGDAGDSR